MLFARRLIGLLIVVLAIAPGRVQAQEGADLPVQDGLWLWLDAGAERARTAAPGSNTPEPTHADEWHDRSGHGRHLTQPLRAHRPAWRDGSHVSLAFDGNDFLARTSDQEPPLRSMTVFVAAAPERNEGNFAAFVSLNRLGEDDFTSGLNIDLGAAATPEWSALNVEGAGQPGPANLRAGTGPFGAFHVLTVRTQPGSRGTELRFDGQPQRSRDRAEGSIGTQQVNVGARFNRYGPEPGETPFIQQFLKGSVSEILVYDRLLDDGEAAAVERYLAARHAGQAGPEPGPQASRANPVPSDTPALQMLMPGFRVRELPVELTNINNLEYTPDGRLFAAGYDGRLHLLLDTDEDGLEDQVTTFYDVKSDDYPLGMAFHDDALFVARTDSIVRHDDTNGDGVPDSTRTVGRWHAPDVPQALRDARRVSGCIGLAVGPDGSIYTSTGSLNTFNAYMRLDPDGKPPAPETDPSTLTSNYRLDQAAGVVLRFPPGSDQAEIVATGVRYATSMRFNRQGDLFATDQEGATWVPNGNPFDELLWIRPGRHYGFPAQHPRFLPSVIDEPSVFDYAPQHQSTCGFRFNESIVDGDGKILGPDWWEGDAIVTGESRGKLFRTQLARTGSGYVGRNQVIGCLEMLTVDVALSPRGDLVVACHSGEPDWGTGPSGTGRLFQISYVGGGEPQPVAAWAGSPTETWISFDRPLDPERWKSLTQGVTMSAGPHVVGGDRFEHMRPGYAVVERQKLSPPRDVPVLSTALAADGYSIVVRTEPRTSIAGYALTLPAAGTRPDPAKHELGRAGGIDLGYDLTGVTADWVSESGGETWSGWLPHPDWLVASAFTQASGFHQALRDRVARAGTLTIKGQLDLDSMLHPAIQPGSKLDHEYPAETVTVRFGSPLPLVLTSASPARVVAQGPDSADLVVTTTGEGKLIPFTLQVQTGTRPLELSVDWLTQADARPRALPLRRVFLPWANRGPVGEHVPAVWPQLAGGDWYAGQAIFRGETAKCASCHTIRGEGGAIGPDLTNLIHRDYPSVRRDLEQPSAAINPDFLSYVVELKDGRVLSGVVRTTSDDQITLAGSDAKVVTMPRAEIESMNPSPVSVMPEKLLEALNEDQVRDLMTYLLLEKPATAPK